MLSSAKLLASMKEQTSLLNRRSTIPVDQLLTSHNHLDRICIKARQIFTEWSRLIRLARHSICIGVFAWDYDCDATNLIGTALQWLQDNSHTVVVKILINNKRPFESQVDAVRKSI